MRYFGLFSAFCIIGTAFVAAITVDPSSFNTNAEFSVDSTALSLSSAVGTIEARPNAPGYSWLRVDFYSFPLTAEDVADATNGHTEAIDRRWSKKPNSRDSHAVIQLAVDTSFEVRQVDMSVPGHACTIAPFEQDVKKFLQDYQFDGKKLRLRSKGSYVCDMKFMGIPNQNFGWDIDLSIPVFKKVHVGK